MHLIPKITKRLGGSCGLFFYNYASNPHYQSLTILNRMYHLQSDGYVIPHPSKVLDGGEDAHFISKYCVGVADGVGGWRRKGIDSAQYSRQLMKFAEEFAEADESNPESNVLEMRSPIDILRAAYTNTKARGSCTACLVQVNGNKLHALNLGDSRFMLCRPEENGTHFEILYTSVPQCHFFNCPYQLGHASKDRPDHGDKITLDLKPKDMIILGTDGLFDNLYVEEIQEILNATDKPNAKEISTTIAEAAFFASMDETRKSPFSEAAKEAGYKDCHGGKMDDITVVAAIVVE